MFWLLQVFSAHADMSLPPRVASMGTAILQQLKQHRFLEGLARIFESNTPYCRKILFGSTQVTILAIPVPEAA